MTGSQLPEWMRDPTTPQPTTRAWAIKSWFTSRKPWRFVADRWWRFQSRSRWVERNPKMAALIGVILAFVVLVGCALLMYWQLWECRDGSCRVREGR